MEAKDKRNLQDEILKRYPGFDPEMDIDWDIVEISFRAGMQEVVEWITEVSSKTHLSVYGEKWHAKLKEWGIK